MRAFLSTPLGLGIVMFTTLAATAVLMKTDEFLQEDQDQDTDDAYGGNNDDGGNGGGGGGGGYGGYDDDAVTESQPNIIMILVDDLGWADVEWTTTDLYDVTPNIANLASGGVKLTSFYAQYQCTPTRAAFLTGRYPARYGLQAKVLDAKDTISIPSDETVLAEHMKNAGYVTMAVGKWHVGCSQWGHTPTGRGFDMYYGFMCSGGMDYDEKSNGNYYDLWEGETMQSSDVGEGTSRTSTLYSAKINEYVASAGNSPLFMYFATQVGYQRLVFSFWYYTSVCLVPVCASYQCVPRIYCTRPRS